MLKQFSIVLCCVSVLALVVGCKSDSKSASGKKLDPAPVVKPPAPVRAMAANPTPPPGAAQKTAAGSGKLAVKTANSGGDTDSFWVANIDIDGDGNAESTQCLYDSEDGVLYLYAEDDITCSGGGTCTAQMLVALYCKGNTYSKPVGSGWCALYLDEDECGADAAGIYGCTFDQNGNPTQFVSATLDEKTDELVVTEAK